MSHQFKLIMSCTFQHSLANLCKTMKYMHAFVCIFFLMKNHEHPMLKNDILVNGQSILTTCILINYPPPLFSAVMKEMTTKMLSVGKSQNVYKG